MNPNEYQLEAMRTSNLEPYKFIERINPMPFFNPTDLLHAQLGVSSESGELADAVKKYLVYGQRIDRDNIKEELGDILWYVALACNSINERMEDIMTANIAKLKLRYPEKFTEKDALERKDKIVALKCGDLNYNCGNQYCAMCNG